MSTIKDYLKPSSGVYVANIDRMCVDCVDGGKPTVMDWEHSRPPKCGISELFLEFENALHLTPVRRESYGGRQTSLEFIHDRLSLRIMRDGETARINCCTNDAELMKKIQDLYLANTNPNLSKGSVYMLVQQHGGTLAFDSIGIGGTGLSRGNYDEDVLDGYDHFANEMSTQDPCGRLFIITGPPGGGKTHLIKGMLDAGAANYAFVPTSMIPSIAGPSIISAIKGFRVDNSNKPLVLVIEDADDCLMPRGPDNMAAISTLLNASEGILGQIMDVRIVATTNAKVKQIDSAITRPGRLCARIHVDKLTPERASSVLGGLIGHEEKMDGAMLADVYRHARKLGWSSSGAKPVKPAKSSYGSETPFGFHKDD